MGKYYERARLLEEIRTEDGNRIPEVVEQAMIRYDQKNDPTRASKLVQKVAVAGLDLVIGRRRKEKGVL